MGETTLEELGFRFQCDKSWEDLEVSSDEGIRFCTDCKKEVHMMLSMDQLKSLEVDSPCIAKRNIEDIILMGEPALNDIKCRTGR